MTRPSGVGRRGGPDGAPTSSSFHLDSASGQPLLGRPGPGEHICYVQPRRRRLSLEEPRASASGFVEGRMNFSRRSGRHVTCYQFGQTQRDVDPVCEGVRQATEGPGENTSNRDSSCCRRLTNSPHEMAMGQHTPRVT